MNRVVALILHARAAPDAGPLTAAFDAIRRRNGERQAGGFRGAGADDAILVDEAPDGRSFGRRLRDAAAPLGGGGLVVLGSGSIPLARAADRRALVAVAGGPAGRALANNRYSADVVALADAGRLAELPDLGADNGLPRWLAGQGVAVDDLRSRWRLQVDLDSPLDALLVDRGAAGSLAAESLAAGSLAAGSLAARSLAASGIPTDAVLEAIARVAAVSGDPRRELVVAGRASAAGLAWLERATASRTRALVEERGFRTRTAGQRPVRSTLGLLLDRDGPAALGAILAELGDAAIVDSRVLLAHRCGADERRWPIAEDRFASDLLLADRVADPWLRALTEAARDAAIPIVLGGHSLVGPGLRLALRPARGPVLRTARRAAWT